MVTLNREELAWAGGFYDGEGCTTAHRTLHESELAGVRVYVTPRLTIGQVRIEPLLRFRHAVADLGTIRPAQRRMEPQWQDQFLYQTNRWRDGQAILAMLWPFLSEPKREQALPVLVEARAALLSPRATTFQTHCKHGHSLADAYLWDGRRVCRPCRLAYQRRRRAA